MALTKDQEICISCQECCKVMTFTLSLPRSTYKYYTSFYRKRGCEVQVQKVTSEQYQVVVIIQSDCPELSPFGCKSYNYRPHFCRLYDGRKDPYMQDKCLLPKGDSK